MKLRKTFLLVVVCALMIVTPVVSLAAGTGDTGISPRYSYTWSVGAGLNISSSGNAKCKGDVRVYDSSSTISMKVSLYQKIDGSWERITSWYDSCTGSSWLEISKNYQLTEYGTYKVLVTGTVTAAGGGSEWISLESDHMTYP